MDQSTDIAAEQTSGPPRGTISAQLAVLISAYEHARSIAISGARLAPPQTCPYCCKRWLPWTGSQLDGHARCVVPDEFKTFLLNVFESTPALTMPMVCAALGVTIAVVRAWCRHAMDARDAARRTT